MHFIRFFGQSGKRAIIAMPYLIFSKFDSEFRWNLMALVVLVMTYELISFEPRAIYIAPICYVFVSTTYRLATFHSMLIFAGAATSHRDGRMLKGLNDDLRPPLPNVFVLPDLFTFHVLLRLAHKLWRFFAKAMLQEVWKISMIQLGPTLLILAIVYGVLAITYGTEYLALSLNDTEAFLGAEMTRLGAKEWPAIGVATIVFLTLSRIWDAMVFVVFAAGSHGLGHKGESFDGLWGGGYRFWTVAMTRFGWMLDLNAFLLGAIVILFPQVTWASLIDFINDARQSTKGNTPREPFTSYRDLAVCLLLFLTWSRFYEAINAATACLAFQERFAIHEQEKRDAIPSVAKKRIEYDAHVAKIRKMRNKRMPSRWRNN